MRSFRVLLSVIALKLAASIGASPVYSQTVIKPASDNPAPVAEKSTGLKRLPVTAFARLPFVEGPKLSPDGEMIAGKFSVNGQQRFVVASLFEAGKRFQGGVPDDMEVDAIHWVGNDHVVLSVHAIGPVAGGGRMYVSQIKTPMLLIHGKKDLTVDHDQSKDMYGKMKSAGKDVEFLSLPNADHFFTRQEDRAALLTAIERFLAQHNPAD